MIDIIVRCNKCKKPIRSEKFFMIGTQRENGSIEVLAHICSNCCEDIAKALLIDGKKLLIDDKEGGAE